MPTRQRGAAAFSARAPAPALRELALLIVSLSACSSQSHDIAHPAVDDAAVAGEPDATPDAHLPGPSPACVPSAAAFRNIYDPGLGESKRWYINDHSIVRGPDQLWHLFGITHEEPLNPFDELQFAHATSPALTAQGWTKRPPALEADMASGETVLWAPHVLEYQGLFYMFYCAGGRDRTQYQMKLATSPDLESWTRVAEPLFRDGYQARDPFVLRVGTEWVMYYTATSKPERGNHTVAYRTSPDLRTWGEPGIAYLDSTIGTDAGNTESPFIVVRDEGYYLFIGPRNGYVSTQVFFSKDPLSFVGEPITEIKAHAPEVVRDLDGLEYITHCGWNQGGVHLAGLTWQCPDTP